MTTNDILIERLSQTMRDNGETEEHISLTIKRSKALEELQQNRFFKNLTRESRKLIVSDLLKETKSLEVIRSYYRENCINWRNNSYDEFLMERCNYIPFYDYEYTIDSYLWFEQSTKGRSFNFCPW